MKASIIKLITGIIAFSTLGFYSLVYASDIDHFTVEISPEKVKVGEAVDVTITAVDKDNNPVLDYMGEIIVLSETDEGAEFPGPLEENYYTFKEADQGKVKFENAVKFSIEGMQDISIYDLEDNNIFGIGEVEVSNTSTGPASGEISITSPENGLTIGTSNVKVSGITLKNHQVKVILNNDKTFETISNGDGVYELEVPALPEGDSILKSELLNADKIVIGSSDEVKIRVSATGPRLFSVKLDPEGEVPPESIITVEVVSTPGLNDVLVILNDATTTLSEITEGRYSNSIISPLNAGLYNLDVILIDELGHKTTEEDVAVVSVKELELESAPEENTSTGTTEGNTEPELESASEDKLKITGLKLTKYKDNSVLTWNAIDISTSYNVYKKNKTTGELELFKNVKEPKVIINITGDKVEYDDFAVKAIAEVEGEEIMSTDYSDMVAIQTGPAMWLALLLISVVLSALFMRKRV